VSSRFFPGSPVVYDLLKRFNGRSLRRFWRIDAEGLDYLEEFERGILAFGHGHLVDGTVFMPLVRQRILFMCDARAVDAPLLGLILRTMGVLRVDVTRPDPAVALAAMRTGKAGRVLGVFPEGKVGGASGLQPARRGVAYLAAKLGVPVLPVAMWGIEAFNRPIDVYVRRLRPVIHVRALPAQIVTAPADDRPSIRAAADAIMVLISGRLPPSMRGVYQPGTEPHARGEMALAEGWVCPASDSR
jgi:1-acyl-sn-glycerol-3-phosphate acyltransferase